MPQTSAGPLQALRRLEPQLVRLLALYVTMKVSLVLVGLLGSQMLPFNWGLYRTNLLLDIQQLPDWMRTFNTWDAQHYVFLAENGYGVNPMSNAFYPLYPYLVWTVSPLVAGHPLIAAWLVANTVSLLVPYFMYKLCRTFLDADQSFRSAALLVSFPTAFFMSVAYTEALYLAVCLASFYYLVTKDVLRASICCFL